MARKSWIEGFIKWTTNIEAAPIFRRWAAITTIGAVLEQKVWVTTSSPIYPNLYTFLTGAPGIGKSRSIAAALSFVRELADTTIAATSMTMASMVDLLEDAKKSYVKDIGAIPVEYNSMFIAPDEFSAFMHEHDRQLVAGLTTFYDCHPYLQARRHKDLRVGIQRPQLSILTGATPINILNVMPQNAWQQGLTSRIFFIFSDHRPLIDVFNTPHVPMPKGMIDDLKTISDLWGEFGWTEDYGKEMNDWRTSGMEPVPTHPRLESYCARRYSHLIKLTMIASADRSDELVLEEQDYETAKAWMLEAEAVMPKIFDSAIDSPDSIAMDEIHHFVSSFGPKGVIESRINSFARTRLKYAIHTSAIVSLMVNSGMLRVMWYDETTGFRHLVAMEFSVSEDETLQK